MTTPIARGFLTDHEGKRSSSRILSVAGFIVAAWLALATAHGAAAALVHNPSAATRQLSALWPR